jgi:putative ATP-dependent endonuclease of the OLD family
VALAQDAEGRTGVVGSAAGDAPQASLLGGLLRDAGLAGVLDRLALVPPGTRAVLVVEGGTDEAYLRLAADRLGRTDVLEDVVILPSSGAMGAALAAIVLRAEVAIPTVVLLDHDDAGRRARDTLVSRFDFSRAREVVTYADVVEGGPPGVEAETLFAPELLRRFVSSHGPGTTTGERIHGEVVTVVLTSAGKSAFVGWAQSHARADDLERWGALLDLLAERLGG